MSSRSLPPQRNGETPVLVSWPWRSSAGKAGPTVWPPGGAPPAAAALASSSSSEEKETRPAEKGPLSSPRYSVDHTVARLSALRAQPVGGERKKNRTKKQDKVVVSSADNEAVVELVRHTLVRGVEDATRLLYALAKLAEHQLLHNASAAELETLCTAHALALQRISEAAVPMSLDLYHLCLRFHHTSPKRAHRLLESMLQAGVRPSAQTFHIAVSIYQQGARSPSGRHWQQQAFNLFHKCVELGVEGIPSTQTFRDLITFCAQIRDIDMAFELHGKMQALGLRVDTEIYLALLALAHKQGDPERVTKLWNTITLEELEPDVRLFNAYLASCPNAHQALQVFDTMLDSNIRPDADTFAAMTSILARAGLATELRNLYPLIRQHKLATPAIYATILRAHVGGDLENLWAANRVWDDMLSSGVPITPAAVHVMALVHCSHSGSRKALAFLREAREAGRIREGDDDKQPARDTALYEALVAESASLGEAAEVLCEMVELGYAPKVKPFHRLAARLSPNLPIAERLRLTELAKVAGVQCDAQVYRTLILNGLPDDGPAILARMVADGLQPDARVYNALLLRSDGERTYSNTTATAMHSNWVNGGRARAKQLFEAMREGAISTDHTYPFNPKISAESFRIMLRKCRRHRDPQLAMTVFDVLLHEYPHIERRGSIYNLLLASLRPPVASSGDKRARLGAATTPSKKRAVAVESEGQPDRKWYQAQLARVLAQMEADGVPLAGHRAASALIDTLAQTVPSSSSSSAPTRSSTTSQLSGPGRGSERELQEALQEQLGADSPYLKPSLMHVYATAADLPNLKRLFTQMAEEGEVSVAAWSALVTGYDRNGQPVEALDTLYEMLEQHGRVPSLSLLGQVSRALEHHGLLPPNSLRRLFAGKFIDIRRSVFVEARRRRVERDVAYRHLDYNRFLYFHLTLLKRASSSSSSSSGRDDHGGGDGDGDDDGEYEDDEEAGRRKRQQEEQAGGALARAASSLLSRMGLRSRTSWLDQEKLQRRAFLISQRMEAEGVAISEPLQQLVASLATPPPRPPRPSSSSSRGARPPSSSSFP